MHFDLDLGGRSYILFEVKGQEATIVNISLWSSEDAELILTYVINGTHVDVWQQEYDEIKYFEKASFDLPLEYAINSHVYTPYWLNWEGDRFCTFGLGHVVGQKTMRSKSSDSRINIARIISSGMMDWKFYEGVFL